METSKLKKFAQFARRSLLEQLPSRLITARFIDAQRTLHVPGASTVSTPAPAPDISSSAGTDSGVHRRLFIKTTDNRVDFSTVPKNQK